MFWGSNFQDFTDQSVFLFLFTFYGAKLNQILTNVTNLTNQILHNVYYIDLYILTVYYYFDLY